MSVNITEIFGSNVFSTDVMRERLPKDIYRALRRTINEGTALDPAVADVVADARRVAVIDGVVDTTNIGAIFRSAAALGMDAVVLTASSCDPLNRRAVRVSMGSVFLIPWTFLPQGTGAAYLRPPSRAWP